jgi:hypothetical protein
MYPQCRYLRPGGQICRAVALKGSEWCYHHARLHQRYRAQQARHRLHKQRDASGRFTPAHHHSPKANSMDARPSQPSHPHPAPASPRLAANPRSKADAQQACHPERTAKSGFKAPAFDSSFAAPLSSTEQSRQPKRSATNGLQGPASNAPLTLPPIEDGASVQLALTDVIQALAANQLDPKRAGVLLYGLQVASTHVQQPHAKPISTK